MSKPQQQQPLGLACPGAGRGQKRVQPCSNITTNVYETKTFEFEKNSNYSFLFSPNFSACSPRFSAKPLQILNFRSKDALHQLIRLRKHVTNLLLTIINFSKAYVLVFMKTNITAGQYFIPELG